MKCKYCNAELRQGAKFCSICGKEVVDMIHEEETVSHEQEAIKPQNVIMSATQDVKCHTSMPPTDNVADTIEPYESGHSSKRWLWMLM